MFCAECGYEIRPEQKFCPQCGRSLAVAASNSVAVTAQPVATGNVGAPKKSKASLALTFGIIAMALWAFPTTIALPVSGTIVGGILGFLAMTFGKDFDKYPDAAGARAAGIAKILGLIAIILHVLQAILSIVSVILSTITSAIFFIASIAWLAEMFEMFTMGMF